MAELTQAQRAIINRKNDLDKNLEEAYSEGRSEWLASDSLLRPKNLQLWVEMKKAEPQWNFEKPSGWDNLFKDYEKRLEYNNKLGEALKADPSASQWKTSPWLMMQEKPEAQKIPPKETTKP